ncbi:MAG: hypothetical protein ABIH09_01180 [Candidatus Omnitrophota bacterium]
MAKKKIRKKLKLLRKKKKGGIAVLNKGVRYCAAVFAVFSLLVGVTGCVPSFPKEKLPEAVRSICKTEYNMDVDVTVKGKTMGIYYPMKGLLDAGLGVSSEAWDSISNLLLIASRVVLSTDADIKFYCVITQDARFPELQVVIIKYVEDVKRGMYRDISRDESFKRTLFTINLTPQAKKERSIEAVLESFGVGNETQQNVLEEFFRSPPTKLTDIGYWREKFYLKDITMEEFLAAQIANRMKLDFRREEDLLKLFKYETAESDFVVSADGGKVFFVRFKISDQIAEEERDLNLMKIEEIIKIANDVVYGYKFKKFDFLMLEDQLENAVLRIKEKDVFDFNKKRLAVKDIVEAPAGYF